MITKKKLLKMYWDLQAKVDKYTIITKERESPYSYSPHCDQYSVKQAVEAILEYLDVDLKKVYPSPPAVKAEVVPREGGKK